MTHRRSLASRVLEWYGVSRILQGLGTLRHLCGAAGLCGRREEEEEGLLRRRRGEGEGEGGRRRGRRSRRAPATPPLVTWVWGGSRSMGSCFPELGRRIRALKWRNAGGQAAPPELLDTVSQACVGSVQCCAWCTLAWLWGGSKVRVAGRAAACVNSQ
eukprot:365785-Chlamydomonas_euryale.AAC.3